MPGFEDFARRMGRLATDLPERADLVVRKTVLAVDQAVVLSTPVDRGRARSNWIGALDEASDTVVDAYVEGQDGSTSSANSQAALAQVEGVVSGYDGDLHNEVHVTNNLPYIEVLNDGSSSQAPADFVSEAVRAGADAVKGSRLLED